MGVNYGTGCAAVNFETRVVTTEQQRDDLPDGRAALERGHLELGRRVRLLEQRQEGGAHLVRDKVRDRERERAGCTPP